MRTQIKKISLQTEIVKYIERYIKEEGLKSGDRLPSQGELVEMMGVSRTSLREAIRSLEGQGLIHVKNGQGVFVGENFRPGNVQITLSFHQEKENYLETLEVRDVLEKEILKMVTERITDEEIEKLGVLTAELMRRFHAKLPKAKEDRDFHQMIYSCCHNSVMSTMMESVSSLLDKFWAGHPLGLEDPFEKGLPYHEELYLAIKERNYQKALRANAAIIEDSRQELMNAVLHTEKIKNEGDKKDGSEI